MDATAKRPEPLLREIKTGGASLFVFNYGTDHPNSMRILADNNLRFLTYQEAFVRSERLIRELDMRWFWLAGSGLKENEICAFDKQGNLVASTGKEMAEERVRVFGGSEPLSLCVKFNSMDRSWFFLNASSGPHNVASLIVGIKKTRPDALRR